MEPPTRKRIFELAAAQLRQDFLTLGVVPDSGARGGEAEQLVRSFLKQHIPRRFDVTSGFILDQRDPVSRQTDVIVYDALNCPTYRASETAAVLPANNVAAVVEVKSTLDASELHDAFDKIESVKSLAKHRGPDDSPLTAQTHGSVFAFKSSVSLDALAETYRKRFITKGIGHHAGVICVLDQGIITPLARLAGLTHWGGIFWEGMGGHQGEGTHLGVGVHQLGTAPLDAYLRLVLAQLTLFRSFVDHPGFKWSEGLPPEC